MKIEFNDDIEFSSKIIKKKKNNYFLKIAIVFLGAGLYFTYPSIQNHYVKYNQEKIEKENNILAKFKANQYEIRKYYYNNYYIYDGIMKEIENNNNEINIDLNKNSSCGCAFKSLKKDIEEYKENINDKIQMIDEQIISKDNQFSIKQLTEINNNYSQKLLRNSEIENKIKSFGSTKNDDKKYKSFTKKYRENLNKKINKFFQEIENYEPKKVVKF